MGTFLYYMQYNATHKESYSEIQKSHLGLQCFGKSQKKYFSLLLFWNGREGGKI